LIASRLSVAISGDRRTALVTVRPGAVGADEPGSGERALRGALEQAGVTTGVLGEALERIGRALDEPAFEVTDEIVARGTVAQAGHEGRFEPAFLAGIQPGHLREDGTLDFFDRELLKAVQKGDVLGLLRPPQPGVAGCLVDGTVEAVPPVREAVLELGPGVERGGDGVVRAARSGVVAYQAGTSIDVVDNHVHQGPVDLRSGHLRMQGSVQVKGDVLTSFCVSASGDIEISGSVDGGNVHAGGDVRVHGVRGERAMVCAEGNLSVHHAESATLYAGKLLQLGEGVHAQIAAGRVEVSGKLRGGVTRAESSVSANEVGSPHGKETEIAVAEPLELPVESALRSLDAAKTLRAAKPGVGDSRSGLGGREKGGKVGRVVAELQRAEIERLSARAQRRAALSRVAFIQVGRAHPGVTLHVGDRKLLLEREIRSTRFSLDGDTGDLRMDTVVK